MLKKLEKTLRTLVTKVVDMDEFHNRDDFELTLIKFTRNLKLPETSANITDYTYVAKDCFHLSQKGHRMFAFNQWNQMLTDESKRFSSPSFNYSDIKRPTAHVAREETDKT